MIEEKETEVMRVEKGRSERKPKEPSSFAFAAAITFHWNLSDNWNFEFFSPGAFLRWFGFAAAAATCAYFEIVGRWQK